MAELYLARTMGIEGFEKLVVVKRILPQYANNSSFVNMFLNEARLAATFQHPNIAQVYDIGQEQGEFFFSMEYVHGEDLANLVRSGTEGGVPISLDAALTLVAGLCAGLHHAHEKTAPDGRPLNVVHRDVSPSNVLVSYDGAVKLVDFGIARANTTPGSTSGGLKGKISYMSPEQCRGKTALDRRSDVFSVGTILYELTTGQLPFTDETEYAVLNHIVNTDAVPPTKIVASYPPALEAIVMRALARDLDQRYATALELQGALEDFAHENRLRVSPLVLGLGVIWLVTLFHLSGIRYGTFSHSSSVSIARSGHKICVPTWRSFRESRIRTSACTPMRACRMNSENMTRLRRTWRKSCGSLPPPGS